MKLCSWKMANSAFIKHGHSSLLEETEADDKIRHFKIWWYNRVFKLWQLLYTSSRNIVCTKPLYVITLLQCGQVYSKCWTDHRITIAATAYK